MFNKKFILPVFLLGLILAVFFHKVFINGFSLFPGDLLINSYSPFKYYSYLGYNPGSFPSRFQYVDVARQLYPWKDLTINIVKSGEVPLWNPYNFSGTPLLANLQSQVLSPLNILYFILPTISAWNISLIFQIILAFIFTYLYLKKIKVNDAGALLSSIAFSCSLYMSTFFEYGVFGQTIMWLPLILYSVEDIIDKTTVKGILLLVASFVFASFSGHLQLFAYVTIFSLIYIFTKILTVKKKRSVKAMVVFVSLAISLGISAVQLLPSIELIELSARSPHDKEFFFSFLLLKANELITIISPDFFGNPTSGNYLLNKSYPQTALYIGSLPLILALSAFFAKKTWILRFFIYSSLAVIVLVTVNPISTLFYSLNIPFLSSSAPTNGIFLLSFALSVLAGIGLDNFIKDKNRKPLYIGVGLLLFLLVIVGIFKALWIEFNIKNTLLSVGVIGISVILLFMTKLVKRNYIVVLIILVFCVLDLFYYFRKFNPIVPRELVFPEAPVLNVVKNDAGLNRVWGYKAANIEANLNIPYGLYSAEGYDPLYLKQYGEFIYSSENKLLSVFNDKNRSDANLLSTQDDKILSENRLKALNLLGVKYILDRVENGSSEKIFPNDVFENVYDKEGWKIFENKNSVPRAFLTSSYQTYSTSEDFSKKFFSKNFDPSKTVLLRSEPSFKSKENTEADSVKITAYKPNTVDIQVDASEDKVLFLSDAYAPGWTVYIDGKSKEILMANYSFRAVSVPKGKHLISFIYAPKSFTNGLNISIISLFVLLIFSSIIYIRKGFNEKN